MNPLRRTRRTPKSARRPHLAVESLEARALMSGVQPVAPGISLNAFGTVNIVGDQRNQEAAVWIDAGQVHVGLSHITWKEIVPGNPMPFVEHTEKAFPVDQVQRIYFTGRDGADKFTNNTALPSRA